jgi:hypothetical protein
MEPNKYIVLAEVGKTEFISDFFLNKNEADKIAQKLDLLPFLYKDNTVERITKHLQQLNWTTYKLKGNGTWFGNYKIYYPNTDLKVSLVEIDMKNFCMKTFICERQYHSLVFNYENINHKILPEFPYIHLIAN